MCQFVYTDVKNPVLMLNFGGKLVRGAQAHEQIGISKYMCLEIPFAERSGELASSLKDVAELADSCAERVQASSAKGDVDLWSCARRGGCVGSGYVDSASLCADVHMLPCLKPFFIVTPITAGPWATATPDA